MFSLLVLSDDTPLLVSGGGPMLEGDTFWVSQCPEAHLQADIHWQEFEPTGATWDS